MPGAFKAKGDFPGFFHPSACDVAGSRQCNPLRRAGHAHRSEDFPCVIPDWCADPSHIRLVPHVIHGVPLGQNAVYFRAEAIPLGDRVFGEPRYGHPDGDIKPDRKLETSAAGSDPPTPARARQDGRTGHRTQAEPEVGGDASTSRPVRQAKARGPWAAGTAGATDDLANMPHENKLEEVYYFKISQPEGFAIQRLYTKDGRIDETLTVRDNDLVLVREGYHPVVAGPGYHCYYLNVLAGDVRSMQAADDPDYAWVRETWAPRDAGSPLHKLIGGRE